MKFKAQQIAEVLEGDIVGDPNREVFRLSKIEQAEVGSLAFLSNPKYNTYLYTTEASVVIVDKGFVPEKEIQVTLIKVENARSSFSKLLEFYDEVKGKKKGREQPHYIAASSKIGANAYIGAFSYIGENVVLGDEVKVYPNVYIADNVVIGDRCTLFSGVKIYSETNMGKDCVVHSGAIIGSDGFGFVPDKDGVYKKVPQIGNVLIEDRVEIGAATTIDRATLGSTIIREGVKLDNQIQIAHNVEIGKNTAIAAQTGVAGSTKIGENCLIGGQVGIVGHLTIGNNVKIQAKSGLSKNVKDGEILQGAPAFSISDFRKSYVYFKKLPQMATALHKLKSKINPKKKN